MRRRDHTAQRRQPDPAPQSETFMNPRLAALALAGFLVFALSQARRSGGNAAPEESLDSVAVFELTTNRYAKRERRADYWHWPVASHTDPSLAGDENRTTGATNQANAVAVLRTNAMSRIANELVVTLPAGAKIQDLLNVLGGDVELVASMHNQHAHRLRFADAASADAAQALLDASTSLGTADSNYRMDMPPPEGASSEKMGVKQPLRVNSTQTDGYIIVGLVDSTVQLQGTAVDDYLLPGISVAEGPAGDDSLSHGTSMAASIVQGLSLTADGQKSSSVKILPVDVYGAQESTTTFQVAEGIAAAIESGANIINLSLGSDGDSALLRQVIQDGHSQGVIFLGAAGNEPVTTPMYPAAYSEVIAVTATDYQGNIASYANYGEFVDVGTPGSVIVEFNGRQYLVSGTSASTALASGIAAGYSEWNVAKPTEAEAAVRSVLGMQTQ